MEASEEQYQIVWNEATFKQGGKFTRKLTIDRKTAKAVVWYTNGSSYGSCKQYAGDIKQRIKSDILPQVSAVTKWSVAEVSKIREKEAANKAELDARDEMETVL